MQVELRTLVLNADFTPLFDLPNLRTIPATNAIVGILKGNFNQVCCYDRPVLCSSVNMYWPSVISLKEYININSKIGLNKLTLYYRDGGICMYCGKQLTINDVTKDHVIPTCSGGINGWENIVCSCYDCNNQKGCDVSSKWQLLKKPFIPSSWDIVKNRKKFPIIIDDYQWKEFLPEWEGEIKLRFE